jgi:hypothetical protein
MGGPGSAASPDVDGRAVILLMQDAKRIRFFCGDLTQEQAGQVVRAANRSEEVEACIRQRMPPAGA